jgi:hypothetical protein
MQVEKWLNPGGAKSSSWLVSPALQLHHDSYRVFSTLLTRFALTLSDIIGSDTGHLLITRIELSAII